MGLLDDIKRATLDPIGRTKELFGIDEDNGIGLTDLLNMPKEKGPALPERQDVVTLILGEQLEKLRKNRNGLGMMGQSMEPADDQVASTSLFGI